MKEMGEFDGGGIGWELNFDVRPPRLLVAQF